MNTHSATLDSVRYIYKIIDDRPHVSGGSQDDIQAASSLDMTSGYIHMSSASQIPGTLNAFYRTNTNVQSVLYVLRVPVKQFKLEEELRWESPDAKVGGTRDGEGMFPHLYLLEKGGQARLALRVGEVEEWRAVSSEVGEDNWDDGVKRLRNEGLLV